MGQVARKAALKEAGVSLGMLAELLGFALRRASVYTFAVFKDAMEDKAITPQRYSVLEVIGANPGIQAIQLARALNLSQPAITVALDFWEERGCIHRRRDSLDRRSSTIQPTTEGQTYLDDLRKQVNAQDRNLAGLLTQQEEQELTRLLAKICGD